MLLMNFLDEFSLKQRGPKVRRELIGASIEDRAVTQIIGEVKQTLAAHHGLPASSLLLSIRTGTPR
jgi:hypothetical protein